MSYHFIYDLTRLSGEFFKNIVREVSKQKLHGKQENISKNIVKKFNVDKILGIRPEDAISVVEDLADIQIKNLVYEEDFKKAKKKVLLVSHCCRKYMDSRCKAKFDPEFSSYFCNHCLPDCLANQATVLGEEKGYKVFILPGGSCMPKIIANTNCDAVLGIACPDEIKLGIEFVESEGLPIKGILLTKNGCANTEFDLDSLKEALV